MSFEITPEIQEWAKELFDSIAVGGIWSPDGSGLTYQKTSDDTFLLVKRMKHADAMENHARFASLLMSIGVNMAESDDADYEAPTNPQDAFMLEQHHKLEIAQSWKYQSGVRLADMPLETFSPSFLSTQEVLLEDGATDEIELWAYIFTCPESGDEFNVDPDDYHLLAGDKLYMRYINKEGTIFQALTRREMVEVAEGDVEEGVVVGTSCPETGEKVPPWLWGTYCSMTKGDEEE